MSDRLTMLLRFCEQRQSDPFVHYAVALEQRETGAINEALRSFAVVHQRFPEYVPNYLHFGMLLIEQGDSEHARRIFEEGCTVASRAGDQHALKELQAALAT